MTTFSSAWPVEEYNGHGKGERPCSKLSLTIIEINKVSYIS